MFGNVTVVGALPVLVNVYVNVSGELTPVHDTVAVLLLVLDIPRIVFEETNVKTGGFAVVKIFIA